MRKINAEEVAWTTYVSPNGAFRGRYKELSLALGAIKNRNQHNGGHPFDLTIEQLDPGETVCPFHDHAAQWELFFILDGRGVVRSRDGLTPVGPGDVVLHPPGDAHQIRNDGDVPLTYLIIADNPPLDVCTYPDSGKVGIYDDHDRSEIFRATPVDYFEGEE